jgi:ABC-type transport system involved in multi-copper enzyme maturation permease subunit
VRAARLVAWAVFRESLRDRVPVSIVVFAFILIAASYLISQLTAGQDLKIVKDLGLAALSILGLVIAVFIGIGLVSKEVERRSIYSLLAKPLTRAQFIVGKYMGLVLTLAVNLSAMTVAYFALLIYVQITAPADVKAGWTVPASDPRLLLAVLLIFGELMLVTAVALFFSTFSSPLLAALLTLGLWVAGHFNADLRNFEAVLDVPALVILLRGLYYLLPNLAPFDVKAEAVYGVAIGVRHVALTFAYAAAYIGVVLLAAIAVFERRDFK